MAKPRAIRCRKIALPYFLLEYYKAIQQLRYNSTTTSIAIDAVAVNTFLLIEPELQIADFSDTDPRQRFETAFWVADAIVPELEQKAVALGLTIEGLLVQIVFWFCATASKY